MTQAEHIAATLRASRLNVSTEAAFQSAFALVLDGIGIEYRREKRLSDRDRVDFFTGEGLAIELKIDSGSNDVMRQLMRYAEHGQVKALMLITTRSKHLGLPGLVLGKPLTVYQVLSL